MAEQAQVSRTERSKQLSSSHSQPVNTASGDYSTAELEACFDPDYNYEGLRDELEQRTKSIRKTTRKGPSSVQRLEKAWSVHRSYKAAAKMQAERSQSASPVAKHIVSEAVDKETDEHAISVQSSCEGSASAGPGSQDLNSHDDNTENFSVRTACKESQSTDQIRTKKATRTNPSQKANASILDSFPVSKPNTSTAKQSLSKKKDAKGGNSPMVSLLSDSEDCQDVAASSTRTKPSNEVLTLPVRTKQPAKDREDPARPLDFPSEIKTIRLQDFVFGKKRYPMFRIPYAAIGTCGGYWRFRSERSKGKGVSNSGEKADDYDHDQEFNEKKIWRGPVDYIDMTGD
ncbi:hypothetical protein KEM55_005985 [Ascosphaera atra]|nr:hypothetical protein KEM55_005985 [Ascosphaera atra]